MNNLPDTPKAPLFNEARVSASEGDLLRASEIFQEIAAVRKNDKRAQALAALYRVKTRQFEAFADHFPGLDDAEFEADPEPVSLLDAMHANLSNEELEYFYNTWISADPANPDPTIFAVRFFIQSGKTGRADALLRAYIALDRRIDNQRAVIAAVLEAYFSRHLFEEFTTHVVNIEQAAWDKGKLHIKKHTAMVARRLLVRKQPGLAEKVLGPAVPLDDASSSDLLLLARIAFDKGDYGRCNEMLERIDTADATREEQVEAIDYKCKVKIRLGAPLSVIGALLRSAEGLSLEAEASQKLFGEHSEHVPFYLSEVEDYLDSKSKPKDEDPTSPFYVLQNELVDLAQLLMTRVPYLDKIEKRNRFENKAIELLKDGFSQNAGVSLLRILRLAEMLFKEALSRGSNDLRIFLGLSEIYEKTGLLDKAYQFADHADRIAAQPCETSQRVLHMALRAASDEVALETAQRVLSPNKSNAELRLANIATFQDWCSKVGADVISLDTHEPKDVTGTVLSIHSDNLTPVSYTVAQGPVLGTVCRNVSVLGGLIPIIGTNAMLHELLPGADRFQTVAEVPERILYASNGEQTEIDAPTILLTGNRWHFNNYFHCLIQNLPRLALLRSDPRFQDYKIGVPKFTRPWVYDLLKRLGYDKDRLVTIVPNQLTTLRESLILEYRAIPSQSALDAVRRLFNVPEKAKGDRKVYAGRLSATHSGRLLANEHQLAEAAAERGFEFIDFAKLGIADQLELMAETKAFAGPNGAAFANMLFAGRDLQSICFSNRNFIGRWYPDIAILEGQEFLWVLGDTALGARGHVAAPKVPYQISLRAFQAAMNRIR